MRFIYRFIIVTLGWISAFLIMASSAQAVEPVGNFAFQDNNGRDQALICTVGASFRVLGTIDDNGANEDFFDLRIESESGVRLNDSSNNRVNVGAEKRLIGSSFRRLPAAGERIFYVLIDATARRDYTGGAELFRTEITPGRLRSTGSARDSGFCEEVATHIDGGDTNRAPIADAGPDMFGTLTLPGGTPALVHLDGTGSSDPDGDTLSYSWSRVSGPFSPPGGNRLINADGSIIGIAPAFTNALQTWRLTVTDGNGGTATDEVVIDWRDAVNTPPTADAGPDGIALGNFGNGAATPVSILLDGSNSRLANGAIPQVGYTWEQISGPTVIFRGGNEGRRVSIQEPNTPGVTRFRLTLTDLGFASRLTDTDEVSITWSANTLPETDALRDQSPASAVSSGTIIQLNAGNITDVDGHNVTVQWRRSASNPGDLSALLDDFRSLTPSFTVSGDGTANFELHLDDGFGIAIIPITITVNANSGPVANAGDDQTITVTQNRIDSNEPFRLSLVGSLSSDPDLESLTYTWTQVSGRSLEIQQSVSSRAVAIFTAPPLMVNAETFVFELVVNDGTTDSAPDQVSITVSVNTPPVVVIVASAERLLSGETLTLDATGTSDPNHNFDELVFSWNALSGSGGPDIVLADPTSPTQSVVVPNVVGDAGYRFQLTVTDPSGEFGQQTVNVIVEGDQMPVALALFPSTIYRTGELVTIDGSGSSDPENDPLTYLWTQTAGPAVTLSDVTAVSPTFTAPSVSADTEIRFSLVVNDGMQPSQPWPAVTTIRPDNSPIAIATISETGDVESDVGIVLSGVDSSDPDGDQITYLWSQISGPSVTLFSPTSDIATFSTPELPDNSELSFQLIVNDGRNSSEPAIVSLSVIGTNETPIAVASVDNTDVDGGILVTLDGSGSSDPDGDALSYVWSQVSGPAITLSDANVVSPTFTAPDITEDSILKFSLIVNDGQQDSDPVFINISVRALGMITIIQNIEGADNQFGFTSILPSLNATITTVNGTGALTARTRSGVFAVTAADMGLEGFALTNLVCSDIDSEVNLAQRTANINLAAGETVTCTFSSVDSRAATQSVIQQALVQRSTLLLANQPSASRRLGRLKGQVSSGSGVSIAGLPVLVASNSPLSASISDRGGYLSASLLQARGSNAKSGVGSFDIWGEATVANFNSLGQDGRFSVLYLGADYVLNDRLLVGGLVQLDDFKSEGDNQVGDVDGNGFMVGPYATAKLSKDLYFDGRLAWGTSNNTISPFGSFVDEFDTSRFLISGSLTGDFDLKENWNIRPTVSLRNLSENQKAYTDSLGALITEQTISTGEVSFSPRVEKRITLNNGAVLSLFGSTEGIVSFGDEVVDLFETTLRGRIDAGLNFTSASGVSGSLSLFADGLGSDDFSSEGIRFTFNYTMK